MCKFSWLLAAALVALPAHSNTLSISDWQADPDPSGELYQDSRVFTWLRGDSVVRRCKQVRLGRYVKQHSSAATIKVKEPARHVLLGPKCDFVVPIKRGWGLAENAFDTRRAYLSQWDETS